MICPITQQACQTPLCLERGECTLQRGAGYSQLHQPTAVDEIAQAQADALEAHSLKYHHCCQLFRLSSGKYALFGSYQVASGIDLLAIGTWEEIRPHVDAYRTLADQRAAEPRRISQKPKAGSQQAMDYSDLFGDQ